MNLRLVALTALLLADTAHLAAQVASGTITGTITDSTNATVPKADVRIINEDTAVARTMTTDSTGIYVARNMIPGRYRIEVGLAGFQPQAKTGLVLSLDQTMTVNFILEPGQQQQVVTVVARSEQLVESATSSLGQIIEETQIRDLPLNGRNFQQLIGLNAGAQPGPQGSFSQGRYHLNGGRSEGNAFLIDGLDTSSHGNDAIRTFPSLEAIGEFKIITNSFSAEYGRSLSGVISTHIKSGTNALHGTLFEFLRNKAFDARNFFAATAPKYTFNQYGGSAGGAIIKDKLFIFGDYQATKVRQGGPQLFRLPTPAQRTGDFSSSLPGTVIYDPRTLDATTLQRTPFPGNRIPASDFDRPAALMLSLLPAPNTPGLFNFIRNIGSASNVDAFDIRGDYHFNERNRLSAVLTYSENRSANEHPFERVSGQLIGGKKFLQQSRTASLNYTRVLGPSAVNELIVGWKRDWLFGEPGVGQLYEPDLGVRYLNTNKDDPFSTGFPLLQITGYSIFGGPLGVPASQAHNIPQLTDNFSFNRGKHAFKTGVALRFRQFNLGQSVAPRGWFTFLSLPTSNGSQFAGGDPVASALLGYPSTARRDLSPPWGERLKEYGFYFQDDWKVNRRLTLNLGVRYDLYPPATEAHDRQANFDLGTATMILAGQNGVSKRTIKTNKLNFSPHLGFAYLLSNDGKTVVRGGYGIGYLLLQTAAVGTTTERLSTNQPFRVNFSTVFDALRPTARVSDGLLLPVGDPKNPSGDVNLHLNGDPTPYMQQWHLNLQHALPLDFLAEFAYAGSHGVHLTGTVNLNQARPGPTAPGPRSLVSPRVNTILALLSRESSIYHSLQAKLQRRFAQGFYILAAYNFSKAIDDGSFTSQGSDAYSTTPQNSLNWRAERGKSDYDFTHRLVASYIYELPAGKGRRFLSNAPAAVNYILGGWQVNGITSLQSGNVFTPIVGNPRTNAGPGGAIRPDRIGSGFLSGSEQNIRRWFDKSAFVAQGTAGTDPFHFGNSGRNILRGPKLVNFDFSAFKEFPIRERLRVEFRAEFFNLFNTPNFQLPDRSVDLATSGVISAARDPRQIQFGLKLIF